MFLQDFDKNLDMQQQTQTYSNKLIKSEDDYISQFISLSDEIDDHPSEIITQNLENQEEVPEKRKRSQFHNFQKHLITTIKRVVKPSFKQNSLPEIKAAQALWRAFKDQKKYTKQFLSAITNPKAQTKILGKYRLVEIRDKHGEEVFNLAQEYLKNQIIQTFDGKNIEEYLYDRRIEKKEEFSEYLETAMQELREGMMNRRLNTINLKSLGEQ